MQQCLLLNFNFSLVTAQQLLVAATVYIYFFIVYSTGKEKWFTSVIPSDQYQERLRARTLNENNADGEDGGSEEEEGPTFKRLSCQALIEESVPERRRKMQSGSVEKNCCRIL